MTVEFQSSLILFHMLGQWTLDVKKKTSIPQVQIKKEVAALFNRS